MNCIQADLIIVVSSSRPLTVKHLMFAWDLFCEFHDSLKITKFNTSELEKKKKLVFFSKKNAFTCTSITNLLCILVIVNVSADRVLSDKYGKPCFSFFDYALHNK